MSDSYYDPKGLKKFGKIGEFEEGEPKLADKFFDWYGEVFKDGALTAREKALIALAVSHSEKCPYCIDAYTTDCLKKGVSEAEMMEAVHVAGAIKGGAVLVHGVQMMDKVNKLSM
jgi:alkylhydroperoxidase/carboxymuconolactone decarboxylase family protein